MWSTEKVYTSLSQSTRSKIGCRIETMSMQIYIGYRWVLVICILSALWASCIACPAACQCKWKGGKQTVECRSQGLITLPSPIDPATQVLDLSLNNLQILPREVFSRASLVNLQKIFLHACRLGQLDPNALTGLTNLVELDLSSNLLTTIPSEAFRQAPSLRELRLNSNPIQKIDDRSFEYLPGLVKLDLSDCQIAFIGPRSFEGLQHLSHLRLGDNKLTEISSRVVTTVTRLHAIELHNNPWTCDCHLRFMRDWLQQYNIPTPVSPTCFSPERLSGKPLLDLQLDDFACSPEISSSSSSRLIETVAGDNATITCHVKAVPAAEISWLWRGRPLANATSLDFFGGDSYGRVILVLEEGTTDKASRLSLQPARESDSGDYICVAANRAGLAQVNFTLRVEPRVPVAGGLGSAQIAGLSAGLFLLLAISVAVFFLVLARYRDTTKPESQKKASQNGSVSMVTEFTPATGTTNTYIGKTMTSSPTANNPDLIYEARKATNFWSQNKEAGIIDELHDPVNKETCCQHNSCMDQGCSANDGAYQSVQNESLYPCELWHRTLPGHVDLDDSLYSTAYPDNIYADGATVAGPQMVVSAGGVPPICRQLSPFESETESISMESYCQPRCIPQHDPIDGAYIPYPADFGLPRSYPENQFATLPHPRIQHHTAISNPADAAQSMTHGPRRGSNPRSAEASPASSAKSPRFWHRSNGTGKRHFARDSPDEGYQEECATDV